MIAFAAVLTVLALQAPAAAPADCDVTDNACKAQQFIARARTAKPQQRALLLFTAHRSYLANFARTGKLRDLCAARTSFERSLAVPGQGEGQRASFEAERAELEALEKQHGARCGKTPKHKASAAAVASAAPSQTTESTTPIAEPPPAPAEDAPRPTTRATEGLLAVGAADPVHPLAAHPPGIDGPRELPAPTRPLHAPARGRALRIVGGTTLGLGFVLLGVTGYAGSQLAGTLGATNDLYKIARARGFVTDPDREEYHRLRGEYRSWLPLTVSTAIVGAGAVITGAVLVHLGVRRHNDGPSRTAVVPVPGGLAIHARF